MTAVAAYIALFVWAMANTSYDWWGALIVGPVLGCLSIPLLGRAARVEPDQWILRVFSLALALKLVAAVALFVIGEQVYDGVVDAGVYAKEGERIAELFRQGIFTVDLGRRFVGTGFTRGLTGAVFAVIGPTQVGGFLVFSWLGFWGLYFFYRAFRVGFPEGDHRRYALLVFFVPSLLYWPSSIGKEAWMILTLGLAALGVARISTRQGGWLLLGLGLLGTACVRPHMSALVCAGLIVAYVLRRSRRRTALGPVSRVLGLLVVVGVTALVLQHVERFFGIEDEGTSTGSVDSVLDSTTSQSTRGGSAYAAERVRSPLDVPRATVSVLFRPFPFETHNLQALLASLEGVVLIGLFALGWRRLRDAPRVLWRRPYLAFAAVYAVLFIIAFSSIGNFGILTRQRTQVFPLVLTVLAVPPSLSRPQAWRARN